MTLEEINKGLEDKTLEIKDGKITEVKKAEDSKDEDSDELATLLSISEEQEKEITDLKAQLAAYKKYEAKKTGKNPEIAARLKKLMEQRKVGK